MINALDAALISSQINNSKKAKKDAFDAAGITTSAANDRYKPREGWQLDILIAGKQAKEPGDYTKIIRTGTSINSRIDSHSFSSML